MHVEWSSELVAGGVIQRGLENQATARYVYVSATIHEPLYTNCHARSITCYTECSARSKKVRQLTDSMRGELQELHLQLPSDCIWLH